MKIFIGMHNITSLFHEYAMGFRALGHEVFTVEAGEAPPHVDGVTDVDMDVFNLARMRLLREKSTEPARWIHWVNRYREMAWEKALEADVCLFIWNTFSPDCRDLVELKRRGKKIIVRFIGAESRIDHADEQFTRHMGLPPTRRPGSHPLHDTLHYVRMAEKHADLILGFTAVGLRPAHCASVTMVDRARIPKSGPQREIPLLLHAPSGRQRKGTGEWLRIFDELHAAGLRFGVKICERMPHLDFLREYATADIYCGSLYIGGKADRESLAAGNVVLSTALSAKRYSTLVEAHAEKIKERFGDQAKDDAAIREYLRQGNPHMFDYPVVRVSPESAKDTLAEYIGNYALRSKQSEEGCQFVERYCDPALACAQMLEILDEPESLQSQARQISLGFFNQAYDPPDDPEQLALYNNYTQMVKPCPWYKRYVTPCERHGLHF